MLDLLDESLKQLLEAGLQNLSDVDVSFEPLDKFTPSTPTVHLFLYDVRENRDLRNNEWLVERNMEGTAVRRPPPVRVDCSYLVTVWTPTSDSINEHLVMGEVMRALLRYPELPEHILPDELKAAGLPLPVTSLHAGRLQSMAEFWQALGAKPKTALNYLVTIAVEPLEAEEAPLVLESGVAEA